MTTTDTPVNNGVNVEFLLGARGLLTETPQAAEIHPRCCRRPSCVFLPDDVRRLRHASDGTGKDAPRSPRRRRSP